MEYNYNHFPSHSSSFKTNSSSKAVGQGTKKSGGRGTSSTMRLSTDPQSVAARERRHRISDRFKILQSMVPGGTKMDTVSMLDEAIQYVKFLKEQIWIHRNLMVNLGANNDPAAASVVGLHLPPPPQPQPQPQPPSADVITSFSFCPSQYEQYPDHFLTAHNNADHDNNLLPPLPPQQPPFIPVPEYSCFHAPDNATSYCYDAYTIDDYN